MMATLYRVIGIWHRPDGGISILDTPEALGDVAGRLLVESVAESAAEDLTSEDENDLASGQVEYTIEPVEVCHDFIPGTKVNGGYSSGVVVAVLDRTKPSVYVRWADGSKAEEYPDDLRVAP